MIILSTIGSILCVVLSFGLCWFLRMRRNGIQIHTVQGQYPNNKPNDIQV